VNIFAIRYPDIYLSVNRIKK